MNQFVNKFFLDGDKFMPEMHLTKPGFTYSTSWSFIRYCERIPKLKHSSKRNINHIYRNELDKACFPQNAAYSDSKDLSKRTISDKVLKDKSYKNARNPKYDAYQKELASMVC